MRLSWTQANEVLKAAGSPLLQTFTGVFAFTSVEDLRPKFKPYSDSFFTSFDTIARTSPPTVCIPDVLIVADRDIFFRQEFPNPQRPSSMYCSFNVDHTAAEYEAEHEKVNLAVQAFLAILYIKVRFPETECSSRRFVFPNNLINRIVIPFLDPTKPVTGIINPPIRIGE
jgi:hypothetical protein